MSKPKINVRMEHVTRRADRRGPERAGKGRRKAAEDYPVGGALRRPRPELEPMTEAERGPDVVIGSRTTDDFMKILAPLKIGKELKQIIADIAAEIEGSFRDVIAENQRLVAEKGALEKRLAEFDARSLRTGRVLRWLSPNPFLEEENRRLQVEVVRLVKLLSERKKS